MEPTQFRITRRGLVGGALCTGLAWPASGADRGGLTGGEVVERMKSRIGKPWFGDGVDGFKAGSEGTLVTGIATTMMATFDALKAARRQGLNMVITHESTYWSHQDNVEALQNDPLYLKKLDYLTRHGMISYHLHDNWHALRPIDGINRGTMELMGWQRYMHSDNQRMFTLPPTTLLDLAREFERRMEARTMRIVGDPELPVSVVYESWGNCGAFPGITFLQSAADVLVIGETQDWDLIAYAQDLVASGAKKGLIIIGHVKSEQWGMKYCAEWLSGFVSEVPVQYVPVIEPYWNIHDPVFEIDTSKPA